MGNPGQTGTTGTFKIFFLDQNMNEVEYIDNGVTFEASVNGFNSVAVQTSNPYINSANVGYKFTLQPHDSFTNLGIIKLTFPTEI